jgi:hypothetical protein
MITFFEQYCLVQKATVRTRWVDHVARIGEVKSERNCWKEKAYYLTSGYELVLLCISSVWIALVNKYKSKVISVLN